MSTITTEPTPTTEAQDVALEPAATPVADTTQEAVHDLVEAAGDDSKAGREAAKYRRQLREVETERDTLKGQLDALRRAEVDRQTTEAKLKPAALWASGADLAGLLAEDGTVDAVKVAHAITAARDTLGIPTASAPPAMGTQGNTGGPIGSGQPRPTWDAVLRA